MIIYQVDADIIPFSFGNSIFINRQLHNETELQDIIRHEFVHVKQQHSIDIIWSELLCVINWFNPFAWLIKKAIRQNLEFIADDKVLQNGINKQSYQYLLLKVTGNNQFSIGTPFNFSSLKKRIAMMNKMKSARLHLIKFLFLLPMLAVLLLAFRNKWPASSIATGSNQKASNASPAVDASPDLPLAGAILKTPVSKISRYVDTVVVPADQVNAKGYFIEVWDNNGKTMVVVKDKNQVEVKRLSMKDWYKKQNYYEGIYGEVPPPPPPPPPPAAPLAPLPATGTLPAAPLPPLPATGPLPAGVPLPPTAPLPPAPPSPPPLPANVSRLDVNNNKATVWLKNGKKESYDLKDASQKEKFENTYKISAVAPKPAVDL